MLRRCVSRLCRAGPSVRREFHVTPTVAEKRERHVTKEKYKKEMETVVDTSNWQELGYEELGLNEVEKKKGLVKPRHPVQTSINYLKSQGDIPCHYSQELGYEELGLNEVEKKKGLVKPRHPVQTSINYLKSQGDIPCHYSQELGYEELGLNEVEKKKGLVKPRHPVQTSINYLKSQGDIPCHYSQELGYEELGLNEVEKKKGLVKPRHPVQTSINYLKSQAYKDTYESLNVYQWYRRNIKGQEKFQPKPRHNCVDPFTGRFRTNNPCPVCRDEYLVLDYQNVELLRQFVDKRTGEALHILITGLCQEEYLNLQAALLNAKRHGFLEFDVPFRRYDYSEHYPWIPKEASERESIEEGSEPLPSSKHTTYQERPEFIPDVCDGPYDLYWKRWDAVARKHPQGYQKPRPDTYKAPVSKKDLNPNRHMRRPSFVGFKY